MGREFIIDEIRRLYSSSSEECNKLLCDKGYKKLKGNSYSFSEIPLCWKVKDSWGCPFDRDIEEGYTWECLTGFLMMNSEFLAIGHCYHSGPPDVTYWKMNAVPDGVLFSAWYYLSKYFYKKLDIMKQGNHLLGLSDAQVLESRRKNGANVLTPPEKEPLWKQFLEKFGDPLIIILMIAGALSIGISCYEFFGLGQGAAVFFEPVGIFVAILLATGLAFYFELQADKEFTILNQVNDDEPVEVIRNGNTTQIPRKDIVVGDIVILNTGEEVPADSELLEATSLHMDESTLTGEPMCGKSVDEKDFDKAATYPTNHVMKGTKVMEGHGICSVLAVGDKTEQGKVFEAVQIDDSVKTPLNEQLKDLGDWITYVSYGFAALIVIGRIIMYFVTNGTDCFCSMEQVAPFIAYVLQTLMIAVTLVVVAVPEGLPMAVTLSLA